MPMKTRELIKHMDDHALQNYQGNHTCKLIHVSKPDVVS